MSIVDTELRGSSTCSDGFSYRIAIRILSLDPPFPKAILVFMDSYPLVSIFYCLRIFSFRNPIAIIVLHIFYHYSIESDYITMTIFIGSCYWLNLRNISICRDESFQCSYIILKVIQIFCQCLECLLSRYDKRCSLTLEVEFEISVILLYPIESAVCGIILFAFDRILKLEPVVWICSWILSVLVSCYVDASVSMYHESWA